MSRTFLGQPTRSLRNICQGLADRFDLSVVLITLGAEGAGVYHEEGYRVVPGQRTQVVDTIGAGDAFSAAFLSHYLLNGDPVAAVEVANAIGAYVASKPGALPAYQNSQLALLNRTES